jgi:DNA invertase Pin-like site-specific DNA recombinase
VNAGLARARSQGKKLGRPMLDADVTARIRTMAATGHSQVQIARETGASRASVQRALKSALWSARAGDIDHKAGISAIV